MWRTSWIADFETQEWHRLLFDFGGGGGAEETDVVPELVRSLVAPIVLHTALKVLCKSFSHELPVTSMSTFTEALIASSPMRTILNDVQL
jgi:hypothetical protein